MLNSTTTAKLVLQWSLQLQAAPFCSCARTIGRQQQLHPLVHSIAQKQGHRHHRLPPASAWPAAAARCSAAPAALHWPPHQPAPCSCGRRWIAARAQPPTTSGEGSGAAAADATEGLGTLKRKVCVCQRAGRQQHTTADLSLCIQPCSRRHRPPAVQLSISRNSNPTQVQDASARIAEARRASDLPALQARLALKENEAAADDVWSDAAAGQALMAEIAELKSELAEIRS
jgi:hypothetical protein